jgi:oxygen-independent coproporphyrinogen-3 oxidase
MAGIYLHIPFCRQACHYCDFHFSTSLKTKDDLLMALQQEIRLQEHYFDARGETGHPLETLYFGGGTPSLLGGEELQRLTGQLTAAFPFAGEAEVTLEANPDDLGAAKVRELVRAGVNRLSIGVQSFFDEDLRFMNRLHNAAQAEAAVKRAQDAGITNISIDLMYGIPGLTPERWRENLSKAFALQVPHLSCYALTVEERTALSHMIRTGKMVAPDEAAAAVHFRALRAAAAQQGFEHYEISNFALPGFRSRHNSSYWTGAPYLGLGPGAHSFNGEVRQWNVRNNNVYIRALQEGRIPAESEILTKDQHFNETVMIRLRTIEGLRLEDVRSQFGNAYRTHLEKEAQPFIEKGWLRAENDHLQLSESGMLFADRISSGLFSSSA